MMKQLSCFLIVLVILTACGESSPQESTATTIPATPTGVPTTLVIWYSDPILSDALSNLMMDFETAHPFIDITLTLQEAATFRDQISDDIRAGQGPDMVIGSVVLIQPLAEQRQIIPLDSFGLRDLLVYTMTDAFQNGYLGENIYGFPLLLNAPVLYSNTLIIGDVPLGSFDEFMAAGSQFGAVVPPDFILTSGWLLPASFPRPLLDGGVLNIAASQLTDYLNRLAQVRDNPNMTFSHDSTAFMNGEVGLYIGAMQELPAMRAALGENLGIQAVRADTFESGYNITDVTMMMMSLNATDANLEAGRLLMVYLAQPEQQRKLSQISGYPPMRAGITDDRFLRTAAALTGVMIPAENTFYADMLPRLNTTIAQVLSGVLTPEQASESFFNVQ